MNLDPRRSATTLFTRDPGNPIITADLLHYAANAVFNPGAARLGAETVLLAASRGPARHLPPPGRPKRRWDRGWRFDAEPLVQPDPARHPEELWGCEDPRITWLPERDEWAIAYTAYSQLGPLVSLATTRDFRTVRRLGPVMPPEDKDAALFPRRIGGRWAMIHRPTPLRGGAHMWVSYSPDLRHWGDHSLLVEARDGAWWDAGKVGLGPPPIETEMGWLVMYHGVHLTAGGPIYRAGFALLDLDDPTITLRRSEEWVIGPAAPYERAGDVDQVVFPCGWVVDAETDRLLLYYGAADTAVAVASATFSDVLAYVAACPQPRRRRASDQAG